jgi:hypothetical protein
VEEERGEGAGVGLETEEREEEVDRRRMRRGEVLRRRVGRVRLREARCLADRGRRGPLRGQTSESRVTICFVYLSPFRSIVSFLATLNSFSLSLSISFYISPFSISLVALLSYSFSFRINLWTFAFFSSFTLLFPFLSKMLLFVAKLSTAAAELTLVDHRCY